MQGRAATLLLLCGGFSIYFNAAKIFSHIVCLWSFTMNANVEGMQRAGFVADSLSTVTALASEPRACKLH
jgi:hypothetical protein